MEYLYPKLLNLAQTLASVRDEDRLEVVVRALFDEWIEETGDEDAIVSLIEDLWTDYA